MGHSDPVDGPLRRQRQSAEPHGEGERVVVERERAHKIIQECFPLLVPLFFPLGYLAALVTIMAFVIDENPNPPLWWVLLVAAWCAWEWRKERFMYRLRNVAQDAFDAASEPVDQAPGARHRRPDAPGAARP